MSKVLSKKDYDPGRVNEISAKLMANPDIAKLIGELSASTSDASDLIKGLLQAGGMKLRDIQHHLATTLRVDMDDSSTY